MSLDRAMVESKVAAAVRLMNRAGLSEAEQDGIIEAITLGSILMSMEIVEERKNEG